MPIASRSYHKARKVADAIQNGQMEKELRKVAVNLKNTARAVKSNVESFAAGLGNNFKQRRYR